MEDRRGNRSGTSLSGAFTAGAAWALFALAAARVSRVLVGAYPADGWWTAAAFALAGALGAWLTARSKRLEKFGPVLRGRPIILALTLAFFFEIVGAFPPGHSFPLLLYVLLIVMAGFSLGAFLPGIERSGVRGVTGAWLAGLAGAAVGFPMGGQWLIPEGRFRPAAILAAALFILASLLRGRGGDEGGGDNERGEDEEEAAGGEGPAAPVLAALFLGGAALPPALFAGLRSFDLLLGPTFRVAALFLSVTAAFLFAGGFAGLLIGRRRPAAGAVLFAALLGASLFGALAAAPALPYYFVELVRGAKADPSRVAGARWVIACLAAGPPALFGGGFALLLLRSLRRGGRIPLLAAGAAALPGIILGLALAPCLIGAAGIRGLLAGVGILVISAGLVLLVGGRVGRAPVRAAAAILLIFGLVVSAADPPRWKGGVMGSGPYRFAPLYGEMGEDEFLRTYAILPSYYRDGRRKTVVVSGAPGTRHVSAAGWIVATDRERLPLHNLLGRLPLLYRPEAETVFLAGAEAGITAGSMLRSEVRSVRCVEPEPAVFEALRHFSRVNDKPWQDGRMIFEEGDPRRVLAGEETRYDIIAVPPPPPSDREESSLGTDEFFLLAASQLRPGGLFATAVDLPGIREDHLASMVRGFRAAFPHAVGFRAGAVEAIILIGSDAPLVLEADGLREAWKNKSAQADLMKAGLRSAFELIPLFRLDGETADRFAAGARENTDRNGHVEFDSEAHFFELGNPFPDAAIRGMHLDYGRVLAYGGMTEERRSAFEEGVAEAFRREGYGPGGLFFADRAWHRRPAGSAASLYAHFLKTEADDIDSAMAVVRSARAADPEDAALIRQLADYAFAVRDFEECENLMNEALGLGLRESWVRVLRGKARLGLGRHEEGLEDLLVGKDQDRLQDRKGDINFFLGMAYKNLGQWEESQNWLSRSVGVNPSHIYAKYEFGENKLLLGKIEREEFDEKYAIPFTRARADSVFRHARERLHEPQHAEKVERELTAVINTTPKHFGAYLALAEFYGSAGNEEKERQTIARLLAQFDRHPDIVARVRDYLMRSGGRGKLNSYRDVLDE
ncbi:MAG: hypothetical protein ABIK65_06085 [Candidatus Eisenbacteria bacterium]